VYGEIAARALYFAPQTFRVVIFGDAVRHFRAATAHPSIVTAAQPFSTSVCIVSPPMYFFASVLSAESAIFRFIAAPSAEKS
jgi:hypothetical protein